MFACGISVFAVASAGCALSNSLDALTAWRAVQGVGGGLVEAGVFIAMAELFEPRVRGKYMGILSSMYGLASICLLYTSWRGCLRRESAGAGLRQGCGSTGRAPD